MRPGAGWTHNGGSVWEHINGARVHLLGLVRLPNGDFLSANKWPDSREAARMIRINGENRKRGLMAWALSHNAKLTGAPCTKPNEANES
jgi:hypothetical protein